MSWLLYAGVAFLAYRWAIGSSSGQARPKRAAARSGQASPADEALAEAYERIGVRPEASDEEVRKAYQAKVREYHPDRVASAADEIQALAERRTKELNVAYDRVRRSRDGNLPSGPAR